jgi:glutathione S-transferase
MDKLVLYVGNKNYSSWSLRPWLALDACDIPFEDVVIPFDFPAGNPRFREISPTGCVPVLHHGDVRVWESLAIIEYVAELFPEAGLWPENREDRARARSYSMEMLSGFRALRGACPMNIRGRRRGRRRADRSDLARGDRALRRPVPLRPLHRRRRDVRAGRQPFRRLRTRDRSGDAGLYGRRQGAPGLQEMGGSRKGRALDRPGGRGLIRNFRFRDWSNPGWPCISARNSEIDICLTRPFSAAEQCFAR